MSSTPPRIPLRDLPATRSTSDVDTVSALRSALRDLEEGHLTRSANIVDQMGRDDRLSGLVRTRVQQLLGLPLSFEARGDKRQKTAIVREVEDNWWAWCPESVLSDLEHWTHMLGIGIAEAVWTKTSTRWTPKLRVHHPQYVFFDWSKRCLQMVTQDGVVDVTPGDGRWIVHAPYGLERAWMHGLVRSCAMPWLLRQWVRRDWARHSEVRGQGIKRARMPSKADGADKDLFFESLKSLHSEGIVLLPRGGDEASSYDLDILEAEANTWEGFDKLIARCDTALAVAILGQNLTTEVQGGSRAASQTHDEVRQDLREFDAESLATTLHEQLLRPWAQFNYGNADLAPWPKWDTEPPADEKAEAETLNTLADALTKLGKFGLQVDVVAVAEQYGVPLLAKFLREPKSAPEPPEPNEKPGKLAQLSTGKPSNGQDYADKIADDAIKLAAKTIRPDVDAVIDALNGAESFESLKASLPDLLASMDPHALGQIVELADDLAFLTGRMAIREEK